MARRRTTARSRREHVYGVPVPHALHEAIEKERSNLSRAESVLGCLAISMENETDSVSGPYYPDVARLAREMVRRSINGLDSLELQRHILRNKIKEEPRLAVEGAYAAVRSVESIEVRLLVAAFPRYFSSARSACMKICG